MSKSPDSVPVGSYDGSGDWFKLWESGVCRGSPGQDGNWCLWQKDRIEVALPGNIPPGEYLVRVEHIGLHEAEKGRAQFYSEFCLFYLFLIVPSYEILPPAGDVGSVSPLDGTLENTSMLYPGYIHQYGSFWDSGRFLV